MMSTVDNYLKLLDERAEKLEGAVMGSLLTEFAGLGEFINDYLLYSKYIKAGIAALQLEIKELKEAGQKCANFVEGFCNSADRAKPDYWHKWNELTREESDNEQD